ncbi:MAG: DUF308 domain-containing protein [Eubacteriales bacterium]|nr:DUF308 domain-containing protein [Eubacteriales bacterium]MDD4323882.1 DUF308 domain-containing protein [Eubacteriales bacterium]MDD4540770.1 DUF308 domain-containing protein [Eubacteriales bacterium]
MKNSNKVISLIVGILFVVLGIIALADMIRLPEIIGILLGAAALVQGLRIIWIYIRTEDKSGFRPNIVLVWGILLLMLAVFLFLSPSLASTIAVYLVGAWFIADAVASFFTLYLLDHNSKIVSIVLSVLILAGGLILILHQRIGIKELTVPIAVTLILDGISILLLTVLRRDPVAKVEPFENSEEVARLEEEN